MGANTQRVGRVLVSNTATANVGNSVTTIATDDVILFNRAFNQVADTDTVQNSADAVFLYIALGGPAGIIAEQDGIQTRHIRNVKVTPYVAPTPYSATITVGTATSNTDYVFKLIYRDEHPSTPGHSAPRSYSYTSDATATAQEVAAGFVAAINRDSANVYVTAVDNADGTFTVTAKPLAVDIVSGPERVTFDVALPAGFTTGATFTYNPGTSGSGVGAKLKEVEREANNYTQRRLWPVPTDGTRTQAGGKYNVVTIEHYAAHLADFSRSALEPRKTLILFPAVIDGTTGAVTAGAKQTSFMTKLTSVVESADVFVQ